MTSASRRPVARLSRPGDVVATIPTLCGFLPQDSVVVLSLRGPTRRLGLTVRLDLPPAAAEADAAELLAERVAQDGAAAAVLVVFGSDRRPQLVDAVTARLDGRGVEVAEALHVDGGRWTSYRCAAPCCPPDGTPVPAVPALVDTARAYDGRVVLSSRDELVASLAAPTLLQAQASRQALEAAAQAAREQRRRVGVAAARAADRQAVRAVLDRVSAGGDLDLASAARVAAALGDVRVRDEVGTWSLKRADALLSLLEQVARCTVPPYDAPVCALLAWVAYARGDGSRANVALDRALQSDPGYSLAVLLRTALDGAVPPREVRGVLRATSRALRAG